MYLESHEIINFLILFLIGQVTFPDAFIKANKELTYLIKLYKKKVQQDVIKTIICWNRIKRISSGIVQHPAKAEWGKYC